MKKMLPMVLALFANTAFAEMNTPTHPPQKAILCVACHGQTGVSTNPEWPNLAGQHAGYLEKQLLDFKAGKTRTAPTMAGIVVALTPEDIHALAQYYASQPIPTDNKTSEKNLKKGETLYRGGDFSAKITACIACHGPKGTGNGQAGFPVLSGQHAPYTVAQLNAFQRHERQNDVNHIMQDISSRLSENDMRVLADYVQGLH